MASGLVAPVWLTHAGDGSGRRFVVDQVGLIHILDGAGNLLPQPFLDVTSKIVTLDPGFDERGLLGLAFHPAFATNGRFFVRYSAPRTPVPGEPCDGTTRGCHREILAEYRVLGDPATNDVADAASERILLSVDEPQFNHNGGHVAFGPDGMLYLAFGDGGGAHDGLADSPPSHGPLGNGQDVTTLLGSLLRIDVDATPDPGLAYAVPADNPRVGLPGRAEIFAFGLRNPYRFSFDDGPGGDGSLYVADVGQGTFEELDVVVPGGNYGWAIREGNACFDPLDPLNPPASCPGTGSGGEPLRSPVLAYDHAEGLAIVGGFVYRGAAFPALRGRYVFGDYSRSFAAADGRLFFCDVDGPTAFVRRELLVAPGGTALGLAVLGIGRDEEGELYLLANGTGTPSGSTGQVMRLAEP